MKNYLYRVMKKFIYCLSIASLIFSGCTKKEEPKVEPGEEFLASTTPMNRVAVLEDFTGVRCGYCPDGHIRAKAVADANPGKFIIIATHANQYANPVSGWANFTTTEGTAIDAQAKPAGYPAGTINRMKCTELGVNAMGPNSLITMDRGQWAPAANKAMTLTAPVNIGAKATFDPASRLLTVKVDLYYTSAETVPNNINISLLQDHLLSTQADYSIPSPYLAYNYEQNHVLRDMITNGNFGETITEPTTLGSKISKIYTYTVPQDYNGSGVEGGGAVVVDNLKIVIFVTRGQLEILNALSIDVK